MADGTSRQPLPGDQGQLPPRDTEIWAQGVQPGQPLQQGDHHHVQRGQPAAQVPGQGYPVPQPTPQFPQQAAPIMYQGYGVPTPTQPYQGVPMTPQPAGQVHYNVPPAGPAAAGQPPALQVSVGQVGGVFGGATIRIQSPGLAAGGLVAGASIGAALVASKVAESTAGVVGAGLVAGVTTLAGFYVGNRQQADEAIHRVVDRERHIQVEEIEEGSLLVRVKFLTLAGYWVIRTLNQRIHQGSDRTCLQLLLEDELQRIGWTRPIQVGLEGWWFAEEEGQEEEEAAETEQEGEEWKWAGMMEEESLPSSTTEGDSGLPEDVSSVAAMSIASGEEVEEGPLKWRRAILQKYKDSPTAQRRIKSYRSLEKGAEILTGSGYTDLEGVKALVLGFMQNNMLSPDITSKYLYEQTYLSLNKVQLKQLTASQLQVNPMDSTCLLLTAIQLPHGDIRVLSLQLVVDTILQHGPEDWLYQHLHHIYCYLGWAIRMASVQPQTITTSQGTGQTVSRLLALPVALSTMASSFMYKQDHFHNVFITATLSKEVSKTEAIRQFEHFLRLAPECNFYVPHAHYHLAILYGRQQDRQKVIHHFTRGLQTETNRLPLFGEAPMKVPARKAYEQVIAHKP
ncbi:uncharacterized protein LOC144869488 [Branchiostoma floridae x Branchiostoma japonicum]